MRKKKKKKSISISASPGGSSACVVKRFVLLRSVITTSPRKDPFNVWSKSVIRVLFGLVYLSSIIEHEKHAKKEDPKGVSSLLKS